MNDKDLIQEYIPDERKVLSWEDPYRKNKLQNQLMEAWENTSKRKMNANELKEWSDAARIAAASEEDNSNNRVLLHGVELRAEQLENDARRNLMREGESEEEFNDSRSSKQKQYIKIRDKSWALALRELEEQMS